MSAQPSRPGAAPPARDPEAEYYQSIEEHFVSRRGDPLFLSNADWVLIRGWREAGLPLRVVLRGITDAMDSHEHSWSRGRKVGSLRYCGAEVEAAAGRWRLALAGGQESVQVRRALAELAEALGKAPLGPSAGPIARELAAHLSSDRLPLEEPEEVEVWLRAAEARLLAAIVEDTPEAERRALEDEVAQDLAAYAERLPERVLAQVRSESLARRRLEACGLTRMSLWSL